MKQMKTYQNKTVVFVVFERIREQNAKMANIQIFQSNSKKMTVYETNCAAMQDVGKGAQK